jgi:hypothetical protein
MMIKTGKWLGFAHGPHDKLWYEGIHRNCMKKIDHLSLWPHLYGSLWLEVETPISSGCVFHITDQTREGYDN